MPASSSNPLPNRPLGLFTAYGLEVEYMLVDGETLDVAPAADALLEAAAGKLTDEFLNGDVAWNNELALHVIELNCNGPRPSLDGLGAAFAANVRLANEKLGREAKEIEWLLRAEVAERHRQSQSVPSPPQPVASALCLQRQGLGDRCIAAPLQEAGGNCRECFDRRTQERRMGLCPFQCSCPIRRHATDLSRFRRVAKPRGDLSIG